MPSYKLLGEKKEGGPYRRCIVCGERSLKKDLLRFSFDKEKVLFDLYQMKQGRGFYAHVTKRCLVGINFKKKFNVALNKLGITESKSILLLMEKLSSDVRDSLNGNIKANRVSFNIQEIINLGFLENVSADSLTTHKKVIEQKSINKFQKRKIF